MKFESKKISPDRYSEIKNVAYYAYCSHYIDHKIGLPENLDHRNSINMKVVDFCNIGLQNDMEKQIFLDTYTFPFDQMLYDNFSMNSKLETLAHNYSIDIELLERKIAEFIRYNQFYDKSNKLPAFRDLNREYIEKIEKSASQFNQVDNIVPFYPNVNSTKGKN